MSNKSDRYYELENEEFEHTEINLLDYWMMFWKRRWLITAITLAVLAAAVVKTYRTTPLYTAKSTILFEQDELNVFLFQQVFQMDPYGSEEFYQTQYKLLQSKNVAEEAMKILELKKNETSGNTLPNPEPSADRPRPISIEGRVRISPVKGTRLADVMLSDPDPRFAAEAVNAVCEAFIKLNIEKKFQSLEQGTIFLTAQIANMRAEIEQKEKDLLAYGTKQNIITLGAKETVVSDKLGELYKALTGATIDRLTKEAAYNEIKKASPDSMPAAMVNLNPLIQKLREDYMRLNRDYAKKLETFKPDYPEMLRLKAERDGAKSGLTTETQNLIKTARSDYLAALNKERTLQEAFDKQNQESAKVSSNTSAYNSLKNEIDNKKAVLEDLRKRQNETTSSANLKGLGTSNINVMERAEVPSSPSSPNKTKNMLTGFLLGLLGGLGLAVLLNYLDNSIKTPKDVDKYAKLPTWGIVPAFSVEEHKSAPGKIKDVSARAEGGEAEAKGQAGGSVRFESIELVPYFSPRSRYSESYRTIRTALLLSSPDQKFKCFGVTSALLGEGKTVTLCNLAVTLAQSNKKTLILDADLRKPRQHKIFKIKNHNGLTNYLTSHMEIKDLIKPTLIPNLFLINAGPIPPDPGSLLGSERMATFMKNLRQTFDFILIDMPPLLAVSDAMLLSPSLDGLALVVWSGRTSREVLKRAKENLDLMAIKTRGVILNMVATTRNDYYYYHYYDKQIRDE